MQKENGSEKRLILKNESILKMTKNGHNAKAIARAKYSFWIKKNFLKHAENVPTNALNLVNLNKRLLKRAYI